MPIILTLQPYGYYSDHGTCKQVTGPNAGRCKEGAAFFAQIILMVQVATAGMQMKEIHEMQMEWLGCHIMRCDFWGKLTLPIFC